MDEGHGSGGASMIGRRLGDYEPVEEIGRGGMGVVYRAVQTSTGRAVALKVLGPKLTTDKGLITRFLREARDGARLDHPGIVKVHEMGEAEGTFYFAMELIEGESLEDLLFDRGRLAPSRAIAMGIQVAEALGHAHAEGILHRDIKPANLLIDRDGRCAITDFGIALAAADTRLTLTGERLGSPLYVAPEILRGDEPDTRSDLYSLGVVLFQALTGEAPYPGVGFGAVAKQIFSAPLPRIRQIDASLPEPLDRVIARLMARSPEERYPTAAAAAEALRRVSTVETAAPVEAEKKKRPISDVTIVHRPEGIRGREGRRPGCLGAAVLLAGLAAALGLYLGIARPWESASPQAAAPAGAPTVTAETRTLSAAAEGSS